MGLSVAVDAARVHVLRYLGIACAASAAGADASGRTMPLGPLQLPSGFAVCGLGGDGAGWVLL